MCLWPLPDVWEVVMGVYGEGAPCYASSEHQRSAIEGRLKVATGIRNRAQKRGDLRRAASWSRTVDELLDKLLEVRGQ